MRPITALRRWPKRIQTSRRARPYDLPRWDGWWLRIGRWWIHPWHGRVPVIAGGTNVFAVTQAAFGFYNDGTEAGATTRAAQDTNISSNNVFSANDDLALRLRLDETGQGAGSGATTDDYQLQVNKNSTSYANVTTSSSNVQAWDSGNLTDSNATTQRLTAGGGSFVAGEISEDGLVDNHQLTANNHTEHLYTIRVVSADVAHGDTLDFRVLLNGGTITYSVTPRITVVKTAPATAIVPQCCIRTVKARRVARGQKKYQ